jgi:YVTN family beta-propeller protein
MLFFLLACSGFNVPPEPVAMAVKEVVEEPSRTVIVSIQTNPTDATVTVTNEMGDSATWKQGENEVKKGNWTIQVQKKGWEPFEHNVTIDITKELTVELKSKIHKLKIETHPKEAQLQVWKNEKVIFEGQSPVEFKAQTGDLTIKSSWGKNKYKEHQFLLNEDSNQFICHDYPHQMLHCQRTIRVGPAPKAVAFSPDGTQIWTALLSRPPSVEAYDVKTGEQIASIDLLEDGATELEFSADGSVIWASQMQSHSVFEIDTKTFDVLRQMSSKSTWTKVIEKSIDGKHIYVSNWVGDSVSEIELATGKVTRKFKTHDTPRGLWASGDGKYLYVGSFDKGTVQQFDLQDGSAKTVFSGAGSARHLVADETRNRMYISDLKRNNIWVLNLVTLEKKKLLQVDRNPNTIALSPDGRILFVSCRGRSHPDGYIKRSPEYGTVFVIDAVEGTVLDVVVGGTQPTGLSLSPDGRTLAFSDFQDRRVQLYSVPSTVELIQRGYIEDIERYKEYKKK